MMNIYVVLKERFVEEKTFSIICSSSCQSKHHQTFQIVNQE